MLPFRGAHHANPEQRAGDEPARHAGSSRLPPGSRTPRQWESAVDKQIREAEERGDFDNLPGRGRPLHLENWDRDWGMAFHVLKNAGETLPWISLGKDIDAARAELDEFLRRVPHIPMTDRARARELYLRKAADLDKLLVEYAFSVPVRHLERGRLPPHIAAAQFDAAVNRRA
jgi:DnaJ homolog subfamily C member 28